MAREFTGPYRRRDFLRMTTALGALGITTSLTPELVYAQAKTDLSGVDDRLLEHDRRAEQAGAPAVGDDRQGASSRRPARPSTLTWNSYGDIIGPKYRTNFQGGVKPVVFDATDRWTGQLREFLYPMNEFIDGSVGRRHAEATCSGCCRWSSGRIAALPTPSRSMTCRSR